MVPAATLEQVAALEHLSWYGPAIPVEEAVARIQATGRRYLYPGPASVAEDGTLSDAGLYEEDI